MPSSHVSQRDGTGIHPEAYTNYGLFDGELGKEILSLWLDTWYYDDLAELGAMAIGVGGLKGETQVGVFLARQIRLFAEAFASVASVRNTIRGSYQTTFPSVLGPPFSVESDTLPDLLERLEERVVPLPYVRGAGIQLDVLASVRDEQGTLRQRWLRNVGSLRLSAGTTGEDAQRVRDEGLAPWTARLRFGVVSVFQRDNSAVLAEVRENWKQLRQQNPQLTWDDREGAIPPLVITLADPPSGTLATNQELYERNAPRLREAIAKWERATGHPFQWAVALE
ncbi:MAG: hypothetical protein OJF49_001664 [Ktedonobacterales bacterium]|jgi:hypothetical protein|nr:MAG: hypothetical protein OJF49_001664 [Ktedonobacterales bacterium]